MLMAETRRRGDFSAALDSHRKHGRIADFDRELVMVRAAGVAGIDLQLTLVVDAEARELAAAFEDRHLRSAQANDHIASAAKLYRAESGDRHGLCGGRGRRGENEGQDEQGSAAHGKSFSKRRYKRSATFVALSIGGGHARE